MAERPSPTASAEHHIVVLDGFTLNPGDLSWERLSTWGTLSVHPRTPKGATLIARARDADILITNKAVLDAEALASLPALRFIAVSATGTNVVDLEAARRQGVVVSNVPDYGASSVAEHTFALILEALKRIGAHTRAVAEGAWCTAPDFSLTVAPLGELDGKTLGIVGFGAIGQRVATIARAFRMHVLVSEHTPKKPHPVTPAELVVERCSLDDLFARADIVTLHCPLTEATRGLVDAARLRSMKPGALLVNTARGGLVVEADLAAALAAGTIAGACLDVLGEEPPPADAPLLTSPNCWITPHVAWASLESRRRLLNATLDNVQAFVEGRPINVVN